MRGGRGACALLWCVLVLVSCSREPDGAPAPVVVFAAASTADLVRDVAREHVLETGALIQFNFAGTSTLARQMEHGAQMDVFVAADDAWMDHVVERGLVQTASRRVLLTNELVLVTARDRPLHVTLAPGTDLAGAIPGRIAIADPDHVPAGRYAREALTALGAWDALSPRLVPAVDVRAALRLVEQGHVDVGIVYASDAASSARVAVAGRFPADAHTPIRYPIALGPDASDAATAFYATLVERVRTGAAARHGFTVPPDAP